MNTPTACSIPWPKQLKKTPNRKLVHQLLQQAQVPLSAVDILEALQSRGHTVWLSTIYRVLDDFEAAGMVSKEWLLPNSPAVFQLRSHHHLHFAVCVRCQRVLPMEGCSLDHMTLHSTQGPFEVISHKLQLFGYCGRCQTPAQP